MDRSDHPDAAASPFVLSGESVRWTGRAPSGLRLRAQDAFLIPFSLLWAGFSIFWESAVLTTHAPIFFRLWGLPFVCVGIYIVAGRFFVDAWMRGRTSYTITDRAAYVVRTAPFAAVRRYAASALDAMTYEPRPDGGGTIRLGAPLPRGRGSWSAWSPSSLDAIEDVPNAAAVYELLVRARDV